MKYSSPSLLDGSVTTAKLADGSVTTAKLADSSVSTPKIVDFAVDSNKLAGASVVEGRLASASVTQLKLRTSETSLAGTVPSNGDIDLTLAAYTFWPMIHVSDLDKIRVTGHSVDSPGADNARLALTNNSAGVEDFDLDYRSID